MAIFFAMKIVYRAEEQGNLIILLDFGIVVSFHSFGCAEFFWGDGTWLLFVDRDDISLCSP